MPRPAFQLNIPPPVAMAPVLSTQAHLQLHLDQLRWEIRQAPASELGVDGLALDYATLKEGALQEHNFFRVYKTLDVFIEGNRHPRHCAGTYGGDKFHLSVSREQVPQAWAALGDLLMSEHCPFDRWKVTDMEDPQVLPGSRVGEGAQFTLYAVPDTADSHYTGQMLSRICQFVTQLEKELNAHGIDAGQYPDSDVRPEHWQFLSYRNEHRSDRQGNEVQSRALREEPFYRLMTES